MVEEVVFTAVVFDGGWCGTFLTSLKMTLYRGWCLCCGPSIGGSVKATPELGVGNPLSKEPHNHESGASQASGSFEVVVALPPFVVRWG